MQDSFRRVSSTGQIIVGLKMLNNGHGGIGTPDGSHQGGHPMYGGGGGGGHPGGGGPVEYASNNPNSYLGPSPPSGMNGIGGGHHSGGYCSQMTLNQNNQCPPNTKVRKNKSAIYIHIYKYITV